MDLREEAKAKDAIIGYMLDNPDFQTKHGRMPRMFKSSDFYKSVFGKKLRLDYIERLIEEIVDHHEEIIKKIDAQNIDSNSVTQRFYDSGGFVAEYDREQEANIKHDAANERNSTIQELQLENLQLSNRLSRQKLKTHWIPIGISIVGLILAAVPYLKPPNNVTEERLNPKIDSIQNRLEQLENGLKQKDKEVEQLREELNKAEMMVRVLETSKKSLK